MFDDYHDEDDSLFQQAPEVTEATTDAAAVGHAPRPQPQVIPVQPQAEQPIQAAAGHAPSPDGLGAHLAPLEGELQWLEPKDASPEAAIRSGGFTTLAAAVAFGAGLAFGGPWGAGAGLMSVGALANGYRAQKWWGSAQPSQKHEAVVSGILAVAGGAFAAFAGYKAYQGREEA